ncbi:hypothetical protein K7X08_033217 [Anisodus acutangulus]|uniref:LOB domain-containing protein n=1 Tax=Anisodus acutangulus TaxID=402998 RepID=A0A9Q1R9W7_9SOLA|nr:hypothetical protein K7X08_033217 [Anisodus acutangulus]
MSNNNNNNNAEAESHEVGSNRPACASCKHQRKKCVEGDCVMWRHFPANKMDEFLGVHKVFGISNVTKRIKSLDDVAQQDEAIKSFLWEARLWQEDPVHGPLGEYKKLEQQLKEEQRNKQLQIVHLPDVLQLPPTTSEPTRNLPPLAEDQNMVAPRENSANNYMHGDHQEDYNLVNSTAPNYTSLLQWHGGETQGATNGHDWISVGGRNNRFGFGHFPSHHHNGPIEQMPNGFIPRPAGLQGIVHHPATYNNGGTHIQLHQQRCSYNNMDMGQGSRGRRRKEHSDQFVSLNYTGRHVRGRGIGPISTTSTSNVLADPIIRHGPIISSSSSGPFVDSTANARTMLRPSVNGTHVEDGRNQRAEDLAAVLQDFTNYNHNDLPGERRQHDLESKDDSNSKRLQQQ